MVDMRMVKKTSSEKLYQKAGNKCCRLSYVWLIIQTLALKQYLAKLIVITSLCFLSRREHPLKKFLFTYRKTGNPQMIGKLIIRIIRRIITN